MFLFGRLLSGEDYVDVEGGRVTVKDGEKSTSGKVRTQSRGANCVACVS